MNHKHLKTAYHALVGLGLATMLVSMAFDPGYQFAAVAILLAAGAVAIVRGEVAERLPTAARVPIAGILLVVASAIAIVLAFDATHTAPGMVGAGDGPFAVEPAGPNFIAWDENKNVRVAFATITGLGAGGGVALVTLTLNAMAAERADQIHARHRLRQAQSTVPTVGSISDLCQHLEEEQRQARNMLAILLTSKLGLTQAEAESRIETRTVLHPKAAERDDEVNWLYARFLTLDDALNLARQLAPPAPATAEATT